MSAILPHVGTTLHGPGKRLVVTVSRPDVLAFEEVVAPDAPPVPLHLHLHQAERFTVIEGTMTVTAGGVRRQLGRGETLLEPPGLAHTYANGDTAAPLRVEVALTPPLAALPFFESVYGLGRDGRLPPRSLRDALALAALAHKHGFYLAGPPLGPQRALMALGAGLAVLAGVSPWRDAYAAEPPTPDPLRTHLCL